MKAPPLEAFVRIEEAFQVVVTKAINNWWIGIYPYLSSSSPVQHTEIAVTFGKLNTGVETAIEVQYWRLLLAKSIAGGPNAVAFASDLQFY